MVLTWVYPDDIRWLGSLTGGIVGLVVNLVVFLVAAALVTSDDADKARVNDMFEAAKTKMRVAAPIPPVSLEDQAAELADEPR
jgi:SSS family solute:Na+ symporter